VYCHAALSRVMREVRCDPRVIGLHEPLQEFPCPIIYELAVRIEQLVGASDIGFRLCHRGDVQKNERLPQMVISAESPNTARRCTDDCARLTAPCALAVWP